MSAVLFSYHLTIYFLKSNELRTCTLKLKVLSLETLPMWKQLYVSLVTCVIAKTEPCRTTFESNVITSRQLTLYLKPVFSCNHFMWMW